MIVHIYCTEKYFILSEKKRETKRKKLPVFDPFYRPLYCILISCKSPFLYKIFQSAYYIYAENEGNVVYCTKSCISTLSVSVFHEVIKCYIT